MKKLQFLISAFCIIISYLILHSPLSILNFPSPPDPPKTIPRPRKRAKTPVKPL